MANVLKILASHATLNVRQTSIWSAGQTKEASSVWIIEEYAEHYEWFLNDSEASGQKKPRFGVAWRVSIWRNIFRGQLMVAASRTSECVALCCRNFNFYEHLHSTASQPTFSSQYLFIIRLTDEWSINVWQSRSVATQSASQTRREQPKQHQHSYSKYFIVLFWLFMCSRSSSKLPCHTNFMRHPSP